MNSLTTHFELNHCECGHGSERHSDKIAGQGHRGGHLCLVPTCPCYSFKACKDHAWEAA
jgi:hypothetical protein